MAEIVLDVRASKPAIASLIVEQFVNDAVKLTATLSFRAGTAMLSNIPLKPTQHVRCVPAECDSKSVRQRSDDLEIDFCFRSVSTPTLRFERT